MDTGNQDAVTQTVRADKVERAATDLCADFRRQGNQLRQSQFDSLVLRRNLSPPEMVALSARLGALGVTITDEPTQPDGVTSDRPSAVATNLPPHQPTSLDPIHFNGHFAILTPREEKELGRRIQLAERSRQALAADGAEATPKALAEIIRRGEEARNRMILSNLGLVRFVIKLLRRPTSSLDKFDLFQEGMFGLMRAVDKFDPELGIKFSTYAVWWIRQSILRGLDDSDRTIRLPVHRLESLRRLKRMVRRLTYESGREPTIPELAEALNWTLDKTLFIHRLTELDCVSLDAPIGDHDGRHLTIVDTLASSEPGPFERTRQIQRAELIQRVLDRLTPTQRRVIERRFGLGATGREETLQQLGDEFGVTRERVRQIESKALTRLRKWVHRRLRDQLL